MEGSTHEKTSSLRVASFSYYLDTAKEKSLHKTSPTKFVLNVPNPQQPPKNREIRADMKVDYEMKDTKGPARTPSNPGPRPPSLSSEASSQTAQTKPKKSTGRRILFPGFGCKEPCFNKKDVHTPVIPGSGRINGFTKQMDEAEAEVVNIEPPRASLEVFGSKTSLKGDVAKNMERKLSILTWDAIPNPAFSTVNCDDMASEVSSDLFEIENISGSKHTSVCTSPHYAPSEASIQWSVVTGSAAECSAADGCDEKSVRVTAGDVAMSRTDGNETFGGGKSRSTTGGLLGCSSLKGVHVSGSLVWKGNEKGKHEGLDLSVSLGKSQTNRR